MCSVETTISAPLTNMERGLIIYRFTRLRFSTLLKERPTCEILRNHRKLSNLTLFVPPMAVSLNLQSIRSQTIKAMLVVLFSFLSATTEQPSFLNIAKQA